MDKISIHPCGLHYSPSFTTSSVHLSETHVNNSTQEAKGLGQATVSHNRSKELAIHYLLLVKPLIEQYVP